jgi:hypothetical protein
MFDPTADLLPIFNGLIQGGNIVGTDPAHDLSQAKELSSCSHKGVESNQTQQFSSIQTCLCGYFEKRAPEGTSAGRANHDLP